MSIVSQYHFLTMRVRSPTLLLICLYYYLNTNLATARNIIFMSQHIDKLQFLSRDGDKQHFHKVERKVDVLSKVHQYRTPDVSCPYEIFTQVTYYTLIKKCFFYYCRYLVLDMSSRTMFYISISIRDCR